LILYKVIGFDEVKKKVKAVDLIDEEHVSGRKVGEDRRKIAHALYRGPGCRAQRRIDLFCDQVRERGLAQAWGTIEKDMLGLVFAALGSLQEDAQVLFDRRLADVLAPIGWPERLVEVSPGFFDRFGG
jgi:uncharacterized protein YceH (UPF0502 family)